MDFRDTLGLLGLFIFIIFDTLTELVMTTEFHTNYQNLSQIDIFLIYLGTARIIFDIYFTKNKGSYFDRIKTILKKYWPYLKQNPFFYIRIGIAVWLLVIISTNLYCWYLGVTLCTSSFFTFYIFILTKVILVNSTISLIMLTVTPSKNGYDIIGMSIWLPLVLIPSSLFYYFYVLPVVITYRLGLINLLDIGLTKFEQNLYEFKLAILYIVDDYLYLSNLKQSFCLRYLFFGCLNILGEYLITLHNRPAQLGRFLVQWANWGLDRKVNSLTRKQFISTNYTQKEWGNLCSKIRCNLARNKDNIRYWNYVKSKPRFLPVVFPLPVSNRGSYSHLLSGSLKPLFTSVYFYIKSNLNLIKLYNTMKTLGSNTYYLPLTIEGCTVGVNLSINSLDFQLSCEGKEFKIVFGAENIAKYFSLYNGGLNKDILNPISLRDRLLDLTDPGILGYNPQVFMQRGLNYHQANFTQDESSIVSGTDEPSNLNRGTKRALGDIGNEGAEIGNKSIEVKVVDDINGRWIAYLKFDVNKLYPFTEDNTTEWKDYLEVICTELRVAFIEAVGLDMVEKATMDNIFLDCDDTERGNQLKILCSAIVQATGDTDIDWNKFPLLSKEFIEYLGSELKDNESIDTDYAEDSESDEITETTEHSNNNNYYEPLINDEIQSLIDDLSNRQSDIKSGRNSLLKHLEISLDRGNNKVMEGTNDKKVHPLLSRLYNTNKECFRKRQDGILLSETSINKLIANLENLKSSNDYSLRDSNFSTPLTHDEIQSLIDDLSNRQSNIKSSTGRKYSLKHIEISVNRSTNKIMEGTNVKKVHPLLSRLYNTNREYFYIKNDGYIDLTSTSINKLITNLESLKSSN